MIPSRCLGHRRGTRWHTWHYRLADQAAFQRECQAITARHEPDPAIPDTTTGA